MRLAPLPAVLLALTLAGCAGRASGVLEPVAVDPSVGARPVAMLVAAQRARSEDPGEMFSGERASRLAFSRLVVSVPPAAARKVGEVQWPSRRPGDPAKEFVVAEAKALDAEGALAAMRAELARTPGRRVMVFVHGYNTRFEEAVFRLAQIAHDSRAPAVPALFTWASRGKLFAYGYDRESSTYARDALEAMLTRLSQEKAVGEVTVLAHSMGNWVTMEALRQMAIRRGAVPAKITQVMLAAPDVDVDVFGRQFDALGKHRPAFTLFASTNDEALAISQRLWGGVERLGAIDAVAEPWKDWLKAQRIDVVDLSDVQGDRTGHTTFARSPEIVRSLGDRMLAGQSLHDGGAGIGDKAAMAATGAAQAVGAAAGLAVAAPLAVVDGRTRESLGDRIGHVGDGLGQTIGGLGVGGGGPRRLPAQ